MDASSSNYGDCDATVEAENEAQRHPAKRSKPEIQPEESDQIKYEESSLFSYSVADRFYQRAAQAEDLKRALQQWCKTDTPAIRDLEGLAPYALWVQSATMHSEECSCTLCNAVADLKETCDIFLKRKDEFASIVKKRAEAIKEAAETIKEDVEAMKEHVEAIMEHANGIQKHAETTTEHGQVTNENLDAVAEHTEAIQKHSETMKGHAEAENQLMPDGQSNQNTSKLSRVLAQKSELISIFAKSIFSDIQLISSGISQISSCASLVTNKAALIYVRHHQVVSLMQALRAVNNCASSEESEDTSDSELDEIIVDYSPWSGPSDFDMLCNPPGCDVDKFDWLPSLESEQSARLDQFYKHLKHIFGTASILDASDDQYSRKIEDTVAAIIGWDVRDEPMERSTANFFVPDCVAQGSNGAQTILYAIMGVPMVVSPISQRKATLGRLLSEAQNQLLSRLGNQGLYFLNFGGLGVDCRLFGLVLTMGSISLVVLELSGVGTGDVEVSTRRTMRVPLFDKDVRNNLFVDKAKDLQGFFESAEEEQQDLPAGFSLLARTVMSAQCGQGSSLKASS